MDTESLSDLNSDPDILIARNDKRITDHPVPCEIDQIRYDQRVHTLLLALAVHHAEPQFRQGRVSNFNLLGVRPTATQQAVIPVGTQHAPTGARILGRAAQSHENFFNIELDGSPRLLLASNQRGTLRVDISCVNKYSDLQHSLTI